MLFVLSSLKFIQLKTHSWERKYIIKLATLQPTLLSQYMKNIQLDRLTNERHTFLNTSLDPLLALGTHLYRHDFQQDSSLGGKGHLSFYKNSYKQKEK